jgi:hypothetical protein
MPTSSKLDAMLKLGGDFEHEAKTTLRRFIDEAKGVLPLVAEKCEVSLRTCHRLLSRAGLADYAVKVRKDNGMIDTVDRKSFRRKRADAATLKRRRKAA